MLSTQETLDRPGLRNSSHIGNSGSNDNSVKKKKKKTLAARVGQVVLSSLASVCVRYGRNIEQAHFVQACILMYFVSCTKYQKIQFFPATVSLFIILCLRHKKIFKKNCIRRYNSSFTRLSLLFTISCVISEELIDRSHSPHVISFLSVFCL